MPTAARTLVKNVPRSTVGFALCLASIAAFAVPAAITLPTEAKMVGAVGRSGLYARPARKHAPGSPGTIASAVKTSLAHRKWLRPVSEGALPEPYPDGHCPEGTANVDDRFCIDRWEGTLDEVGDDGSVRAWPGTSALDASKKYRATTKSGVVPQAYISGEQAEAACHAAGKRLCQAVEWRFACGGFEETVYPYGTTWIEGRCNDHGHSPMAIYYPQTKTSWALVTNADMNDPRLNQMEGTVAKTGAHEGCVSELGVYDMVGNVHEWVADRNGTFQGGYYLDTRENGEGCAYRTTAHHFAYHDYSTGFRCCADRVSEREVEE